ncbi:MAG: glycosyltransferase [Bacteroidota bacterium]
MKILWFTNTPCSAARTLGLPDYSGGWLSSLERELGKIQDLELAICFYVNNKAESFRLGSTTYFPVARARKKSKIARFASDLLNRSGNADPSEIISLNRIIDAYKPDLIHVHGTEENFGLVTESCHLPTVISIQGILTAYAEKYFDGIPLAVCKKNEGFINRMILNSFAFKFELFKRRAAREKIILKRATNIFGRTAWDKNVISILAPRGRYFVNNEILRAPFYENVWRKKEFNTPIQLVTTLSDNLYKGFETIVNTCVVLKANADLKFEWHVVGLTAGSETVKIVAKWKKITGLNISFCGHQDENQIAALLMSSDIYIQTSHIENSPNSLCEAMALGMPIIASSAGGTDSLFDNGKEGLLYQPGEHLSLAGMILTLNDNFTQASAMGAAARSRALVRHNREEIVASLLADYKEMIKSQKKPVEHDNK